MAAMDPSKIPLAPNPSGAPPNFENPPSLHDTKTGISIALIIIGAVFLAFRLGTNLKLHRKLCLDDSLCIFAFAGGVCYYAVGHVVSGRGTGRHTWDIPVTVMSASMMQLQVVIQFLIAPTLWAAKSAILALYIRIFGTITWMRRTSYVWIFLMALFYGMNIVIAGVYCVPRKGEPWEGASFQRCTSSAWLNVVVGVFSCVADLVILVLPFPIVWKLHVSMAKKYSLALVVLAIVSLYLRVIIFNGNDPTWNGTILQIVTVAEVFGTVSVSCAPAMSAFWLKIFSKSTVWSELRSSFIFSSRKSQSSKQNLSEGHQNDSKTIIRETTYQVSEDGTSRASSNYQQQLPITSMGTKSQ
ncbi:hypothetical protein BS50DRAFT_634725 [Corynespora cassiicola Philippines]|uniref:Rhodopsin domain-containing protein n=1 Tax=Corynespora cassiicola Philippines TaxID=1448308 RepID=A0A2T2NPH8_CORCC|nr:hypothetical protein BS50DRAFT_634725 [Corynespora cassiicola Philippines]